MGEPSIASTQWEKLAQVLESGFDKMEMSIRNLARNQITMNGNFNGKMDQLLELMQTREKPHCNAADGPALHSGNMPNPVQPGLHQSSAYEGI